MLVQWAGRPSKNLPVVLWEQEKPEKRKREKNADSLASAVTAEKCASSQQQVALAEISGAPGKTWYTTKAQT